jgi:GntR family histidine utilization transcriptional repressor
MTSSATWQAIRDDVLARIRSRDWPPGAPVPNEADLATEWGCARATVNRALREVAALGLIERKRKAGTRVALQPARRATLEIPLIRREVQARGAQHGYALIDRALGPAPLVVRLRLGLPEGATLLQLRALHLADGVPYVVEDRWLNPAAAPGALEADFARISANEWLLTHVPYSHGDLAVFAMAASAETALLLHCPPAAPIFCMERVTWSGEQPITLVTQTYPPGHRMTMRL